MQPHGSQQMHYNDQQHHVVGHQTHYTQGHHQTTYPVSQGHHVSVAGQIPSNYTTFPSPVPQSPLKESPLSHAVHECPCDYHIGTVGVPETREAHHVQHNDISSSMSYSRHAVIKSRGDVVIHPGSDAVQSPYYNSQLSYQPVTEQTNSLAPLQGVHLYHYPDSVDSMKARMVLEEKGVSWTSEIVNSLSNDQYDPEYMSLNPRGAVPTLVVDNRVTTDSRNILNYVNHTFPGPNMVPHNEAEVEVMEHFVDLADRQNVEALVFGKIPGVKKRTFSSPYAKRRNVIRSHQEKNAQNRHLVEAYKQKEASIHYQEDIINSPEKMRHVFGNTQGLLSEVERQLTNGPFAYGGWLASDQFTLADIHILCFLRFLDVLGLKEHFATNTNRYYAQGKTRDSYVAAGDDWTSAYGRVTKHYVPVVAKHTKKNKKCLMITGAIALAMLTLFSLMTFFFIRFFKNRHEEEGEMLESSVEPEPAVVEVHDSVIADDGVKAGELDSHTKLLPLLLPFLLVLPLFLWCCGCIKCKKKSGRSRPRKAVVAN